MSHQFAPLLRLGPTLYVKLDGVCRAFSSPLPSSDALVESGSPGGADEPKIGRPLGTIQLVRDPSDQGIYLLDSDYSARQVRRLVTYDGLRTAPFNACPPETRSIVHLPVGPPISGAEAHELTDGEALQYLENYPDVKAYAGSSLDLARAHFGMYGRTEGRLWTPFVTQEPPPPARSAESVLSLNGANNYIAMPDAVWFEGDFTIETWIYLRSYNKSAKILDFGSDQGPENVVLQFLERSGQLNLWIRGVFQSAPSASSLKLHTWTHVAATLSGETSRIYVNGKLVGEKSGMPRPANVHRTHNYVGRSNFGGAEFLNALLSELRIWSTARTADEIKESLWLRAQGSERQLLGCWPLSQIPGAMLENIGSSRMDGVLNGCSPMQLRPASPQIGAGSVSFASGAFGEAPADTWFDGDFTIEGWVYIRNHTAYARLLDFGNGANDNNVVLCLHDPGNGRPYLFIRTADGRAASLRATSAIPINTWTHVAATLSGTTAAMYLNGVESGTCSDMLTPDRVERRHNYVGRSNWPADGAVDGIISEVRVWAEARSVHQILSTIATRLRGTEKGLIGYWPLDRVRREVLDSGPAAKHGTIHGGARRGVVDRRACLGLPAGPKNHIQFPPEVWFDGDFTIETWIHLDEHNRYATILDFGNGENQDNVLLHFVERTGALRLWIRGIGLAAPSKSAVAVNTWTHIAATLSGRVARLYVDGAMVAETSDMPGPSAVRRTRNYVGRGNFAGYEDLAGSLSELRIWSVARTSGEIADLKDRSVPAGTPYLRACWRMDDGRDNPVPGGANLTLWGDVADYSSVIESDFLPLRTRPTFTDAVLDFHGVNDYVEIKHSSAFNLQTLTLEAWIFARELRDGAGILVKGKTSSPFMLRVGPAHQIVYGCNINSPSGGSQTFGGPIGAITAGRWHHLATTYDGETLRAYVDGVATCSAKQPLTIGTNNEPLFLGVDHVTPSTPDADRHFRGAIAEVRVWSIVRSERQIQEARELRLNGDEAGLVGYWPMDEGSRATVRGRVRAPAERGYTYYENERGRVSLLLDGYLRHIPSPEVYNRLFDRPILGGHMQTFASSSPPFPEGPPLPTAAQLVKRPGLAEVYLLDDLGAGLVARLMTPEVLAALEFAPNKVATETEVRLLGPRLSLREFDKGRIDGATWVKRSNVVPRADLRPAYHPRGPAATADVTDLGQWMARNWEQLKDKRLQELCLPGTHDSGTYELTEAMAPDAEGAVAKILSHRGTAAVHGLRGYIKDMATAQAKSIGAQLALGIRYLDLRACEVDGQYFTCHSLRGNPLSVLLQDITSFLKGAPREIVVVKLGAKVAEEDPGGVRKIALEARVKEYLRAEIGDFFDFVDRGSAISSPSSPLLKTLQEIVDSNRRCIFMSDALMASNYSDDNTTNDVLYDSLINQVYPITVSTESFSTENERLVEAQFLRYIDPRGFVDGYLNKNGEAAGVEVGALLGAIVPGLGLLATLGVLGYVEWLRNRDALPPGSLLENAQNSRSVIRRYFESIRHSGPAPMLLIADFFDSVPYVELAVFRSVGGDYGHLLPQFRDSDLSPSAWDRIRALPPLCLVNALREIGLDAPAAGAALVTEVGDISSDLARTAFDSTSYAADEVSHFVGSVAEEAARDSLRGVETAAVAVADGVVVAANSVAHAGETVAGGVQTAWKVVTGFLGGLFG